MWMLALSLQLAAIKLSTVELLGELFPAAIASETISQASNTDVTIPDESEEATLTMDLQQAGFRAFKQGQFGQAIALYQQALSHTQNNPPLQGPIFSQLGHTYANEGDYAAALSNLALAQAAYEVSGDRLGLVEVDIYRGLVYRRQGKTREALALLESVQPSLLEATELEATESEATESSSVRQQILSGEALHNLAVVYRQLGEPNQAIALYGQAIEIWKALPAAATDHPANGQFYLGRSLNNLGNTYFSLGDLAQAQSHYQQALTIAQSIQNRASEGRILSNLGRLEQQGGHYEQAVQHYQAALTILNELGDRASVASTLNNLGIVYETLGQYELAQSSYKDSLTLAESIGDQREVGNSLDGLGGLHYRQAHYSKALNTYERALQVHQSVQNTEGTAATLTNLGGVYAVLGRYDTALTNFDLAIASTADPSVQAGILAAQGGVYLQLGELTQAIETTQQGLDLAATVGAVPLQSHLLNQLGQIYDQLGRGEDAIAAYQQAIEISNSRNDIAAVANALNSWGQLIARNSRRENRSNLAQPLFQTALNHFQRLGDGQSASIVLSNLGQLYEADTQPALAILFYKQAVTQHEAIRNDLTNLSPTLQQSYLESITPTYRRLADLLLQQDRVLEAQQVVDLLKVQELDDYLRGVRGNENTQVGLDILASEQQIWDEYEQLNTAAIVIAKQLSALSALERPLTEAEIQTRAQLTKQQGKIVRSFSEFSRQDDIVEYVEALTFTAREQSLSLSRLQDLSRNLKQFEDPTVLLYPLILEDRLELIVVAPGVPPTHTKVDVSRTQLNKTIQAFRRELNSPASNVKPTAQQLYNWLIRPIEAQLTEAQIENILYAPDGPLRYIPLAALHDGEQWLIEQFGINNITAASIDDFTAPPPANRQMLVGAFTDSAIYYDIPAEDRNLRFSGLPYAALEAATLQALQPSSATYLDPDFNKASILPNMNSYPIVHFATHASFLPGSPLDSFILLGSGETITLQEVQDEWFFDGLDLIVLSACQTGLSGVDATGEEILGFGYLMQNAGANAAIASLWSVDDGGTQTLMSAFYTQLLTSDVTKAEALRQAQLTLINQSNSAQSAPRGVTLVSQDGETEPEIWNRLSHPYYWSPFILIGNGR